MFPIYLVLIPLLGVLFIFTKKLHSNSIRNNILSFLIIYLLGLTVSILLTRILIFSDQQNYWFILIGIKSVIVALFISMWLNKKYTLLELLFKFASPCIVAFIFPVFILHFHDYFMDVEYISIMIHFVKETVDLEPMIHIISGLFSGILLMTNTSVPFCTSLNTEGQSSSSSQQNNSNTSSQGPWSASRHERYLIGPISHQEFLSSFSARQLIENKLILNNEISNLIYLFNNNSRSPSWDGASAVLSKLEDKEFERSEIIKQLISRGLETPSNTPSDAMSLLKECHDKKYKWI